MTPIKRRGLMIKNPDPLRRFPIPFDPCPPTGTPLAAVNGNGSNP
jgi:hypothetical protein